MEKLNDVFSNIRERFSSPLFFSFLCSWLVINWEITIALLWYDKEQIYHEGYLSVFSFIKDKLNGVNTIIYPLGCAVLYTFISPVVKNLIKVFYTRITKWGENWNLKILDGGKIGIEKYLKLRSNYESRTKILEEVISHESEYKDQYTELQGKLYIAEAAINENILKYNKIESILNQFRDDRILNGWWEIRHQHIIGAKNEIENIIIENGRCYNLSLNSEREHIYDIKNFYYDNRNGSVFFIKESVRNNKNIELHTYNYKQEYNINRLNFENNDLLIGEEIQVNKNVKIQYKRKPKEAVHSTQIEHGG